MAKEMAEDSIDTKFITKLETIPLSADTHNTSCISILIASEALTLAIDEIRGATSIDIYELTMDTLNKYECLQEKFTLWQQMEPAGSRIGFTTLLRIMIDKKLFVFLSLYHQDNLAALHRASLMEVMNDVITIVES